MMSEVVDIIEYRKRLPLESVCMCACARMHICVSFSADRRKKAASADNKSDIYLAIIYVYQKCFEKRSE